MINIAIIWIKTDHTVFAYFRSAYAIDMKVSRTQNALPHRTTTKMHWRKLLNVVYVTLPQFNDQFC